MASGTKIRGITIELGADTTGLGKALGSVNSQINNTQKQLKDLDKLLKLDPTNTELLAQKQALLADKASDLRSKLMSLKDAQDSCDTSTVEGQQAYDTLTREIVSTTDELKNVTTAQQNFNATLDVFKDKAKNVADVTKNLSDKTKTLSTVAATGAAGLVTMAVTAGKSADDLNTLSKQSGFSTDELQKWQYASDIVDVSVDDMVSAATKLTKNMGSTSKDTQAAFTTLGVSVKDSSGNMRDSQTVFYEVLDALGKVQNGTERDQLAMQIFGKSANDLAGIVDDGGAALKDLGQQADDAGLILSGDALNNANAFNDVLDTLKAKSEATFLKAGATLGTALMPVLDKLSGWVESFLNWFGNLDGQTQTTILTVLAVIAAISPLLGIISSIASGAAALTGVITFLISPIGLVIAAIAAAVAVGVLLYQNWDTICQWATTLWTTITTAFTGAGTAISDFVTNAITQAGEFIVNFANGLLSGIGLAVSAITQIVNGIITTIGSFFGTILQTGSDIINNIISGINSAAGSLWSTVSSIGTNIVKGVWDGISSMAGWFSQQVSNFFGGIVDGVKNFLGIHSPSKVFAEIGVNMVKGLDVGWADQMKATSNDIYNSVGATTTNISQSFNFNGGYQRRDGAAIARDLDRQLGLAVI